jgi:hypothetical protein
VRTLAFVPKTDPDAVLACPVCFGENVWRTEWDSMLTCADCDCAMPVGSVAHDIWVVRANAQVRAIRAAMERAP